MAPMPACRPRLRSTKVPPSTPWAHGPTISRVPSRAAAVAPSSRRRTVGGQRGVEEQVVPPADDEGRHLDVGRARGRRPPAVVEIAPAQPLAVVRRGVAELRQVGQRRAGVELVGAVGGGQHGRDVRGVRPAAHQVRGRQEHQRPQQREAELVGAAAERPAVVRVGRGDDRHQRAERRRPAPRGRPLGVADVRLAEHADRPIGPRLGRDPGDRVLAVGRLVLERHPRAARAAAAAGVLHHDGVAGPHHAQHVDGEVHDRRDLLVVRRPAEQGGDGAVALRQVEVGREFDVVARRHPNVLLDRDPHADCPSPPPAAAVVVCMAAR